MTVNCPLRGPDTVGVKVTFTEQWRPTKRADGQLLVWAKSPEVVMALIDSVALPVLLRVKVLGAVVWPMPLVGKVQDVGDSPTTGPMPVPLSAAWSGLEAALETMDKVPVRLPAVVGLKLTAMVQCRPGLRFAGQLLVWVKSGDVLIALIAREWVPVLLRVKALEALVWPMF